MDPPPLDGELWVDGWVFLKKKWAAWFWPGKKCPLPSSGDDPTLWSGTPPHRSLCPPSVALCPSNTPTLRVGVIGFGRLQASVRSVKGEPESNFFLLASQPIVLGGSAKAWAAAVRKGFSQGLSACAGGT